MSEFTRSARVEYYKGLLQQKFQKNDWASGYELNVSLWSIGMSCLCGFEASLPTKANKIDEDDLHGNRWALLNAIYSMANHIADTNHDGYKFIYK